MTVPEYRSGVPDDWFIDPVRLGVPGVRSAAEDVDDDNPLSWQTDALCAQTDPEAFFPEKGGSTRDAKRICASCEVRLLPRRHSQSCRHSKAEIKTVCYLYEKHCCFAS